ncbi:MAG: DUF6531 domain-containing protein, partial [Nitrososphaera sp.]
MVTTPRILGLEVRIPAETSIRDHEGKVATEISITPIPLERPPFPLATNVEVPIYFTVQPGAGYVVGPHGARIIYPNATNQPPGARFNFWHYDPEPRGWYIYGMGSVTKDGKQVVPDPGASIYEFTGAMFESGSAPPPPPPPPPCKDPKKCKGGDPVDLATGLFVLEKTDFYLPGILPIQLTRTYRPNDNNSRPFGIGTTHPYGLFLWNQGGWQEVNLILPDGGRIHYVRISPGTGFTDAEFEHTATPTKFYKSRVKWNGNGWDLTLKDGTLYIFGENAPFQLMRDRYGNEITLTRANGITGNITKITASPSGRWIEFTYDGSNRITQAKDNSGRIVTYTYDASGRLWKVTDPNNGVTEHTYDASNRMLTIKDARGITFLTNQYDPTSGRVTSQTLAPGTYQFAYTVDGTGKVTQTDVTDPRGNIRRVTFNTDGYIVTDTLAQNDPVLRQTTTYNLQAGTNLVLSETDQLGRRTDYTYDAMGNVLTITRLANLPPAEQVTTTFTYEPAFNQVASITDPLNHTTSFSYDSAGNLVTITDPLNNQTTLTYNTSGQPLSVTTQAGTTQFTYGFSDLSTITDPLGNTTNRFTDAAGRLHSLTNPLGLTTQYDYNALNRLTKVTDPLGGLTQFGYDPNGNLLTVTDAKNQATSYTYNNMDWLATRTDPLLKVESYVYDNNGNLTQFTDRKNQPTTYTYDALNRRTQASYADTSTTSYTYDAGNRLTQINDSIAGLITRGYDDLNRLTSETTPQGSVTYTYDKAGRRTSMTVAGQPTVNYTYDNANRLTQITQGASTVTIGYDNANRRTSVTLPNGVLVEYAYDAASRVTGINYKQGATLLGNLTYEYDKAGNRTQTGGSFARTGIPQAISTSNYNAANHQLALGDKTMTFDNNGNLSTITDASGTTIYTWNARNQLTGISGPNVTANFVYDGLGRREKKTVNSNLTEFLYDGVNPVQETSGATVLANILAGLGIDEFFNRTDVPAAVTSHFLPDALGSALALADSAGTVQSEYT